MIVAAQPMGVKIFSRTVEKDLYSDCPSYSSLPALTPDEAEFYSSSI